jgi:ribosomal protein L32
MVSSAHNEKVPLLLQVLLPSGDSCSSAAVVVGTSASSFAVVAVVVEVEELVVVVVVVGALFWNSNARFNSSSSSKSRPSGSTCISHGLTKLSELSSDGSSLQQCTSTGEYTLTHTHSLSVCYCLAYHATWRLSHGLVGYARSRACCAIMVP